jgi:hypothetical protein
MLLKLRWKTKERGGKGNKRGKSIEKKREEKRRDTGEKRIYRSCAVCAVHTDQIVHCRLLN